MNFSWELVKKINQNVSDIQFTEEEFNLLLPCLDSLMLLRKYTAVISLLNSPRYKERLETQPSLIVTYTLYMAKCYQQLAWGKDSTEYNNLLKNLVNKFKINIQNKIIGHLYREHQIWQENINLYWCSEQTYDNSQYRQWLLDIFPHLKSQINSLIKDTQVASSSSQPLVLNQDWYEYDRKNLVESMEKYYDRLLSPATDMPSGFNREIYQHLFNSLVCYAQLNIHLQLNQAIKDNLFEMSKSDLQATLHKKFVEEVLPINYQATLGAAVLFPSITDIEGYFSKFEADHPNDNLAINNSLAFGLPRENDWDRDTWRYLLINRGRWIKSLIYKASAIEQQLKNEQAQSGKINPRKLIELTRKELIELAARTIFPEQIKNHPDYIHCCIENGMASGNIFDSLYFWNQHKNIDGQLPDIIIHGDNELHKYYLCLVKNSTPRVLMLGMETGCCQRYGAEGEDVVVKGIEDPNSGFYAIFKRRSKNIDINRDELKLQSFAWLGENAFVIDSIEAMRPNEITKFLPLYEKLFSEILGYSYSYNEKPQSIDRIVIGCGGNTPKNLTLKKLSPTDNVLHFDNTSLGDATRQFLAAEICDGKKVAYPLQVLPKAKQSIFAGASSSIASSSEAHASTSEPGNHR